MERFISYVSLHSPKFEDAFKVGNGILRHHKQETGGENVSFTAVQDGSIW